MRRFSSDTSEAIITAELKHSHFQEQHLHSWFVARCWSLCVCGILINLFNLSDSAWTGLEDPWLWELRPRGFKNVYSRGVFRAGRGEMCLVRIWC